MSKENSWEVEINPEYAGDPNYVAYKNITGGELVLIEPDMVAKEFSKSGKEIQDQDMEALNS